VLLYFILFVHPGSTRTPARLIGIRRRVVIHKLGVYILILFILVVRFFGSPVFGGVLRRVVYRQRRKAILIIGSLPGPKPGLFSASSCLRHRTGPYRRFPRSFSVLLSLAIVRRTQVRSPRSHFILDDSLNSPKHIVPVRFLIPAISFRIS
jgi:hypothetical protein